MAVEVHAGSPELLPAGLIRFDALVHHGTMDRRDLALFHRTDSVDEAYEIVTRHLVEHALSERGAIL